MKPELTNEMKARFFALYYGLKLMGDKFRPDKTFEVIIPGSDRLYLKLRPITSITDEEAIEVANIVCQAAPELQEADSGRSYLNWPDDTYRTSISDYLRSIGIGLGFMGYSVEELVAAGWVRLVE